MITSVQTPVNIDNTQMFKNLTKTFIIVQMDTHLASVPTPLSLIMIIINWNKNKK